jgi:hypothetical protein
MSDTASFDTLLQRKLSWNFGLETLDVEAAALVARELGAVMRFRNVPTIAPDRTISTGDHVDNVHALVLDLSRDLGSDRAGAALCHAMHRSTECHDWGETIKEFFTFDAECRIGGADIYDTERRIAEFAITLAYRERLTGEAGLLGRAISEMRASADRLEGIMAAEAVNRYISLYQAPATPKDPEIRRRVIAWMHAYDAAEHDDLRGESFIGSAVKLVERLEGQNYFNEHAGRGNALPHVLNSSYMVLKAVERMEGELGNLVSLADSPAEKALARKICVAIYRSTAEMISMATPLIDRQGKLTSEPDVEARWEEKRKAWADLRRRHLEQMRARLCRGEPETPDTWLADRILLADRVMFMYELAADAVEQGRWTPKRDEILIKNTAYPQGLLPETGLISRFALPAATLKT